MFGIIQRRKPLVHAHWYVPLLNGCGLPFSLFSKNPRLWWDTPWALVGMVQGLRFFH
jgi:hypothetical protein